MILGGTRLDSELIEAKTGVPRQGKVRIKVKVALQRGEVDAKQLMTFGQGIAEACAAEMPRKGASLHGAVSVQLETTILGEAMAPKTVVDGLVNRPYTHCLLTRFKTREALWKTLKPATRAYFTFYLRRHSSTSQLE
jgi:hypothetical protein